MIDYFSNNPAKISLIYPNQNQGTPLRHYAPKMKSFKKLGLEELKDNLSPEEENEKIFNLYSIYGPIGHTADPLTALKLNLSAQDYVISSHMKRMTNCSKTGVFFQKTLLWETQKFSNGQERSFLDKYFLTKTLSKFFGTTVITLGILQAEDCPLKSIAWKAETPKGTFFIPWHNGCLLKADARLRFEQTEFNELRYTYKILRFKELEKDIYQILLG